MQKNQNINDQRTNQQSSNLINFNYISNNQPPERFLPLSNQDNLFTKQQTPFYPENPNNLNEINKLNKLNLTIPKDNQLLRFQQKNPSYNIKENTINNLTTNNQKNLFNENNILKYNTTSINSNNNADYSKSNTLKFNLFNNNQNDFSRNKDSRFSVFNYNYNDIKDISISLQLLKKLVHKHKPLTELKPIREEYEYRNAKENEMNIITNIKELANFDYYYAIENYKNFVINNLIIDFLQQNDTNISELNRLSNITEIDFVSSIPIEDDGMFYEFLQRKFINQNTLNNIVKSNHIQIFFGDNIKIKEIENIIRERISKIQNKDNFFNLLESEINMRNKLLSNDEYLHDNIINNNPFLPKTQRAKGYSQDIYFNQKQIEETYITFYKALLHREILNEKLYQSYFFKDKEITETHKQLIIEYSIGRLRELKNSKLAKYQNKAGGNFYNISWCSLFPTDSQIIAYMSIQLLQEIFHERAEKSFLIASYPIPPSKINFIIILCIELNQSEDLLYLYQKSPPDIEPNFCVIFKEVKIDSNDRLEDQNDNFFFCFVILLFLLDVKKPELVQRLRLNDFIKKILPKKFLI